MSMPRRLYIEKQYRLNTFTVLRAAAMLKRKKQTEYGQGGPRG
jgi:hypothetical protein